MEIINIDRFNEITETTWGYCACQSTEAAIQLHREHHGYEPKRVYVKVIRGKRTVYCSLESAE